jgi:predicted transcriptional regulator
MAAKIRLTISLSPDAVRQLDEEAKARKGTRTSVIEEGVRLLRRQRIEEMVKRPRVATGRVIDYGIGYG